MVSLEGTDGTPGCDRIMGIELSVRGLQMSCCVGRLVAMG